MVVDNLLEQRTDRVFHALADRTRRDIVVRVLQQPVSVTDLARDYAMSFAAVQKHVAVLDRAGLVTKERSGRQQLVRGNPETLASVAALLERYEALWRDRAERMEDVLATGRAQKTTTQHIAAYGKDRS
ncbi:MAG: ArsR/SmtB family transcription factor [Propionicimonas sp.]